MEEVQYNDDDVREIVRWLPEAFWDVQVWAPDEHWLSGTVDVADRYRIVAEVKRLIDGLDA